MKISLLLIICTFLVACKSQTSQGGSEQSKGQSQSRGYQDVNSKKSALQMNVKENSFKKQNEQSEPVNLKKQPLIVRVKDLLSKTATVDIRVYNSAESFFQHGGAIATYRFKPKNGVAELTIDDLDFGVYAMAIYQDLDESGEINKNMVGIPNEPFAVTNDVKPGLGAPPFESCSFEYSAKKFEVEVHLLDGVL